MHLNVTIQIILAALASLLILSQIVNHNCAQEGKTVTRETNPESKQWIRKHLVPPSVKPYNLSVVNSPDYSQVGQTKHMIDKYFKAKRGGKFLEVVIYTDFMRIYSQLLFQVGAGTGEFCSNTLTLELDYNWTGILIEPQPTEYAQLLKKHRKSYLLHVKLANIVFKLTKRSGLSMECAQTNRANNER
jgi:hypothetical protein